MPRAEADRRDSSPMRPSRESDREGHVPDSESLLPLWVRGLLPSSPPVVPPNVESDQTPRDGESGEGRNH
jgi:hypothetical protein